MLYSKPIDIIKTRPLKNLNYTEIIKRELHILTKKTHTHTHTHTYAHVKSYNFLILKSLYDILIINAISYISFKILVQ